MRNHDDQALFGNLFKNLHHLNAGFCIKRAGRFVGQNDFGIVDKRSGDCYALHLAAAHFAGLLFELIGKPHFFKRLNRPFAPFLPGYSRKRQRQFNVLKNGLMRNQMIILKNKSDGMIAVCVPVAGAESLRRAPVDYKIAAVGMIQPADDV